MTAYEIESVKHLINKEDINGCLFEFFLSLMSKEVKLERFSEDSCMIYQDFGAYIVILFYTNKHRATNLKAYRFIKTLGKSIVYTYNHTDKFKNHSQDIGEKIQLLEI